MRFTPLLRAYSAWVLPLLCTLCLSAAEPALPKLLAFSIADQTASFELLDGSVVLAVPGTPFVAADQLTLVKILPGRVVLSQKEPGSDNQLRQIWFDTSKGVDAATMQVLTNIPDKQPDLIQFDPPVLIPLNSSAEMYTGPKKH